MWRRRGAAVFAVAATIAAEWEACIAVVAEVPEAADRWVAAQWERVLREPAVSAVPIGASAVAIANLRERLIRTIATISINLPVNNSSNNRAPAIVW